MPPIVATVTLPVAPVPITASICVFESAEKLAAVVPPNQTWRTVLRFVPRIVIVCALPAIFGETSVTVGAGT